MSEMDNFVEGFSDATKIAERHYKDKIAELEAELSDQLRYDLDISDDGVDVTHIDHTIAHEAIATGKTGRLTPPSVKGTRGKWEGDEVDDWWDD